VNGTVTIPVYVVQRALAKARAEYVRVAEAQGTDPGPADECWREFETLAEFAGLRRSLVQRLVDDFEAKLAEVPA
jgi:hypothetical protein